MEEKKFFNGKLLRYGYTTGSCAAGAAKAAARILLTGQQVEKVSLMTPKGVLLQLPVDTIAVSDQAVTCAVRKDGGDDPDATHGLLICATVRKAGQDIAIDGGEGVGRVTKPGLDQPVGNAAINRVPRRMITQAVQEVCQQAGYCGGISVEISVPEGARIGARTFNPHLGILGGISILGTSGIVEPMSDQALIDTIRVELNVLRRSGDADLLVTVGNYAEKFATGKLHLDLTRHLKCANFIGQTLEAAIAAGFTRVLLVGHIGKMVKLGAGIMNTHSAQADARMDVLCTCALQAGAQLPLLHEIVGCATTDAAVDCLQAAGFLEPTMQQLAKRIEEHLQRRFGRHLTMGVVVFHGREEGAQVLCTCGAAEILQERWRKTDDH